MQWFVAALCGWIQREQDEVIAFLGEENRVLLAQLRGRRLRLCDEERRRLALLGHQLGCATLVQVATIATADTILRWHRELAGRTCTHTPRRGGRPRVQAHVRALILRMASENDTWGYTRIQGAMKNLGHRVGRSTIARILKAHGIPPSRQRPMTWRTFVRAHWPAPRAADSFMSEVWRFQRFVTFYTALIAQLHPHTSGRFSAAVGRSRPAQAHATLDNQIDDELGTAHSDLRMGFEEGWWHEPAARHSGRPRAPHTCRRAERRHRWRARPGSMKGMSLIRSAA
jgi:hypothetical protein